MPEVVLMIEAAGAPMTLASTAFARTLAYGLRQAGASVRIVGLARDPAMWNSAHLDATSASTPWLKMGAPRIRDLRAAAASLVLADACAGLSPVLDEYGWYEELLLDRELGRSFRTETSATLIFYPRSLRSLTMAARCARRRGWNLVVMSTEALSDAQIDPETRDGYVDLVARQADVVWAVSRHLRSFWIAQGVPAERLFLSPGLVASRLFKAVAGPSDAHHAVYIGNLAHREVDYLLDIAAQVRERLPGFHLTVYGDALDSRHQELMGHVCDAGLSSAVTILPAVPSSDIPRILEKASVLLLPRAKGEFSQAGFPNKLGEYLASGRPVIVTRVGDIPEYLQDESTAFLVDPDDSRAFADRVVSVLSNRELAERVGAAGQGYAAEHLEAANVASALLRFVKRVDPRPACRPSLAPRLQSVSRATALLLRPEVLRRAAVRLLRTAHLKEPAPEGEQQSPIWP